MCMTDPIADMLTRIRNAQAAEKKEVKIPSSKLKKAILKILKDEGYIESYQEIVSDGKLYVDICLKYFNGGPVITSLTRISKPGLRRYSSRNNLPKVMHGLGIAIVSTSKGVMTERSARAGGVGGELLCIVA
ncbi:SSU ribosomal protein S8P [Nitrosomonas eutropha]|uniref:30S ribosomal protein S8 n=1 Tax=Nitrosomonas TaxID=914 RepID=UPI000885AE20|nr:MULTISPECIES: 30S ribosomal protein S8 [Nitrosomonas]MXS79737.1 30S ribosomal protein S8 [Nitrosomonas sp. GH22]SCX04443.1 SSU ribosomal protein S8P [Nitrosomonas eutropha]SDW45324.1 SSU ribosomal protein S8P [Nitrosomonas eutropha]